MKTDHSFAVLVDCHFSKFGLKVDDDGTIYNVYGVDVGIFDDVQMVDYKINFSFRLRNPEHYPGIGKMELPVI